MDVAGTLWVCGGCGRNVMGVWWVWLENDGCVVGVAGK